MIQSPKSNSRIATRPANEAKRAASSAAKASARANDEPQCSSSSLPPDELGLRAGRLSRAWRDELNTAGLYLRLLRRRLSDDSGSLDIVDQVAARLEGVSGQIEDLLLLAGHAEASWETVPLAQIIQQAQAAAAEEIDSRGIRLTLDVPAGTLLEGDRQKLVRAFAHLLGHAAASGPEGGQVLVTAIDCGDRLEVEVADDGPGVLLSRRWQAFEPVVDGRENPSGWRLAVVKQVAALHGGAVQAFNCPDGGAAYTIRLPKQAGQVRAAKAA